MSCCGANGGCNGPKKASTNGGCNKANGATKENAATRTKESVQEYYGQILQKSADLKTNACTTGKGMPAYLRAIFPLIHDEVIEKYYGCGICVPEQLEGCSVLDLGCGAGRDCYLISKLVGPSGRVVGIDMTPEQLAVANRHVDYHTKAFGYEKPNVEFRQGFIEQLKDAGLEDNSFDVIVSNCVINLSPDKAAVLKEAYRVLKPGGELYFSDVYADRRVPEHLVRDPVLFGECLSGALYWNDFRRLARAAGFSDARLVEDSPVTIANKAIQEKVGHIKFFSATYRLFKLPELEDACEDYGEAVIYKGTLATIPQAFVLDNHHSIQTHRVFPVCRNTLHMLTRSRFAPHFEVLGAGDVHFGLFTGGEGCCCSADSIPFGSAAAAAAADGSSKSESKGGGCC